VVEEALAIVAGGGEGHAPSVPGAS
jgi:hypothetical protein